MQMLVLATSKDLATPTFSFSVLKNGKLHLCVGSKSFFQHCTEVGRRKMCENQKIIKVRG